MDRVFVVQGEHPHHPFYPLQVFASKAGAIARCVELTAEFLKDWWEIHREDRALPTVREDNWSELVDRYGCDEDEVQDDGFGEWWVGFTEQEVKP